MSSGNKFYNTPTFFFFYKGNKCEMQSIFILVISEIALFYHEVFHRYTNIPPQLHPQLLAIGSFSRKV